MKYFFNLVIYVGSLILFSFPTYILLAQPGLLVEQGSGVNNINGGLAILGNPASTHIAIDQDDIQAKSSSTGYRQLELNYFGGDVSMGKDVLYMDRFNKRIGINTDLPDGPVDIDLDAGGSLIAGTPSAEGPGWIHFVPYSTGTGSHRWDAYAGDNFYRIRQLDNGLVADASLTLDYWGRLGLRVPTSIASDLHIKQYTSINAYGLNGIRLEHATNSNYWNTSIDNNNDYVLVYKDTLKVWISETDGNYNKASDLSVKKDIHPIVSVLDQVKQLNPVTYKHKSHAYVKHYSWGFIAQEVEQLFPGFVSEKAGMKGLAYDNFAVLAIKAIQEQQIIIEEKEMEIATLKERLSKIEAHLGLDQLE